MESMRLSGSTPESEVASFRLLSTYTQILRKCVVLSMLSTIHSALVISGNDLDSDDMQTSVSSKNTNWNYGHLFNGKKRVLIQKFNSANAHMVQALICAIESMLHIDVGHGSALSSDSSTSTQRHMAGSINSLEGTSSAGRVVYRLALLCGDENAFTARYYPGQSWSTPEIDEPNPELRDEDNWRHAPIYEVGFENCSVEAYNRLLVVTSPHTCALPTS